MLAIYHQQERKRQMQKNSFIFILIYNKTKKTFFELCNLSNGHVQDVSKIDKRGYNKMLRYRYQKHCAFEDQRVFR